MKVIIVYSGKGGVGKTTVSALLAISLAAEYKVALVDADVNTPSLGHITGIERDNLTLISAQPGRSTGKAAVSAFVSSVRTKLDLLNPDVVIIDTPPSITAVHQALFSHVNPSGVLYVSTPHKLSVEDTLVGRAYLESHFGVLGLGVVVNMCADEEIAAKTGAALSLRVLASVPADSRYADNDFTDMPGLPVNSDINALSPAEFTAFTDNIAAALLKDTRTLKAIKADSKRKKKHYFLWDTTTDEWTPSSFVNIPSWDDVAFNLHRAQTVMDGRCGDALLTKVTSESLHKFVQRFAEHNPALFMVMRPPTVEKKILSCEIVAANAMHYGDKSYYGIPRALATIGGETVVFFPHELSALPMDIISEYMTGGHWFQVSNTRWIPSWEAYYQMCSVIPPLQQPGVETEEDYLERVKEICAQEHVPVPAGILSA